MGPWITMAAFFRECGDGLDGADRNPRGHTTELVGRVAGQPSDKPFALRFKTHFLLVVAADSAIGRHHIKARLLAPDGQVWEEAESYLDLVGIGQATWRWGLSGTTNQMGTYWLEVQLGERTTVRSPLEFRLE